MARAKKSKSKLSELEGQPDPRAALDSAGLLSACQGVLARLEADLLERTKASSAVTRVLKARYEAEKKAERTAESFAGWTALLATQIAAAWVLSCVFVRTLATRTRNSCSSATSSLWPSPYNFQTFGQGDAFPDPRLA